METKFRFEIDYSGYVERGDYAEKIVVEVSADANVEQVTSAYRTFLRAAGYAESSIVKVLGEQ